MAGPGNRPFPVQPERAFEVRKETRIGQQGIRPASVTSRLLADIFSSEPESDALGTAVTGTFNALPDGSSVHFIFTVSNTAGLTIVAVPDVAFTVNGADWPNATHGLGTTPVVVFNDWINTDNHNVATRVAMRNNSGSPIDVVAYVRWRIIANPAPATGA